MTAGAYNFEPEERTVSHHVTSGILNSGLIQIVKVACQFASVIILSRILAPSDFGVIAMVSPVYAFIIIFHDLGLSQATIQKPGLRHEEVNAFFWLNIGMGALLATITVALSPLIGLYYHDERVVPLTIAMGMLILVGATGNQHGTILQRRMQFSSLAMIDIAGTVSGLVVSVVTALMLKSYWALYFGMATSIIVPVSGVWLLSKWKPSFPRFVPGLFDMLKFGAGITSFNLTSFIAGNTDNILIGRTWGDLELGLYDRAYKLLLFPLQRIIIPLAGTMLPLLSRMRDSDPGQYCTIIQNALEQLIFAIWPGIIWAVMSSDMLVPTILGQKWAASAPIFVPLGIASLAQVLNSCPVWIFVSQARGGDYAKCGVVNAVTSVAAFLIGLPYGAFGVAVAYAASEYLRTPLLWWYATRRGPVKAGDIIPVVMPQVASAIVAAVALFYFHTIAIGPDMLLLAIGLLLSYGTFTLTMSLFNEGRKTLGRTAVFAGHFLLHVDPRRRRQA